MAPRPTIVCLLLAAIMLGLVAADHNGKHSPVRDDGGCCTQRTRFCSDGGKDKERCDQLFDCLHPLEPNVGHKTNRQTVCEAQRGTKLMEYRCNKSKGCAEEREAFCAKGTNGEAECIKFEQCKEAVPDGDIEAFCEPGTEEFNSSYREACPAELEAKCKKEREDMCSSRTSLADCNAYHDCMLIDQTQLPVNPPSGATTLCEVKTQNTDFMKNDCGDCEKERRAFCRNLSSQRSAEDAKNDDEFVDECSLWLACRDATDPNGNNPKCEDPDFYELGEDCNCGLTGLEIAAIVGGAVLLAGGLGFAAFKYAEKRRRAEAPAGGFSATPYGTSGKVGFDGAGGQYPPPSGGGIVTANGFGSNISGPNFSASTGPYGSSGSRGRSSKQQKGSSGSRGRSGSHGSRGRSGGSHGSRGRSSSKGHRSHGSRGYDSRKRY